MTAVTYHDTLKAALLLNTKAGTPKLLAILNDFGAKKLSEVPDDRKLDLLLAIISAKQERAFNTYLMLR